MAAVRFHTQLTNLSRGDFRHARTSRRPAAKSADAAPKHVEAQKQRIAKRQAGADFDIKALKRGRVADARAPRHVPSAAAARSLVEAAAARGQTTERIARQPADPAARAHQEAAQPAPNVADHAALPGASEVAAKATPRADDARTDSAPKDAAAPQATRADKSIAPQPERNGQAGPGEHASEKRAPGTPDERLNAATRANDEFAAYAADDRLEAMKRAVAMLRSGDFADNRSYLLKLFERNEERTERSASSGVWEPSLVAAPKQSAGFAETTASPIEAYTIAQVALAAD